MVPVVWKIQPYVWQTMYNYRNWPMSGPSESGECVHVATSDQDSTTAGMTAGVWDTGSCNTLRCVVCELPLNSVDVDVMD